MTKLNILILGATSSIARQISLTLAEQGHHLYLAGRDTQELEIISQDIMLRTSHLTEQTLQPLISWGEFHCEEINSHEHFFKRVLEKFNTLDGVVLAVGAMGLPTQKLLQINFNGAVSVLELAADYFEQTKSNTPRFIAAISSVSGDRGRKSNYLYGAAKGGLSIYLQGLQNRLFSSNIRVINFKLGFVDTAMTYGLPGLFLVASPESIAKKISRKIFQKINLSETCYYPKFWFLIMLIIKNIPEILFKRMSL